MEKEEKTELNQEPIINKPKDKFKPLAIVFIVLAILFAAATGFFVWQWMDQKTQIDGLKNDISKIQEKLDNKNEQNNQKPEKGKPTNKEIMAFLKKAGINDPLIDKIEAGKIEDSSVPPYQKLAVSYGSTFNGEPGPTSGTLWLFRKTPTDVWRYGYVEKDQSSGLQCEFFTPDNVSADFVNSFIDNHCWDMRKQPDSRSTFGEFWNLK